MWKAKTRLIITSLSASHATSTPLPSPPVPLISGLITVHCSPRIAFLLPQLAAYSLDPAAITHTFTFTMF